jgi:hypothetical protein
MNCSLLFSTETLSCEPLLSFPQLHEHHTVQLEDLFELSTNSDAPIHWRVQVMHFYSLAYLQIDWLRDGRSGDRIPVGARFFAHIQTGPGAHPASCTMGTGYFMGVEQSGRGADHPPPPSAEVENEYSYTSTPPVGPSWPVIGWPLPFTLPTDLWNCTVCTPKEWEMYVMTAQFKLVFLLR